MTRYLKYFLGILMFSNIAFAAGKNADSYWQCTTRDIQNWVWTAKSAFQKTSTNLSYDACKKNSKEPTTCKTSADNCEFIKQGVSTRPLWRCTAIDFNAASWKSNYYRHRLDAAVGAQQYCLNKSTVPTTCYVNMVTCYNQNEDI